MGCETAPRNARKTNSEKEGRFPRYRGGHRRAAGQSLKAGKLGPCFQLARWTGWGELPPDGIYWGLSSWVGQRLDGSPGATLPVLPGSGREGPWWQPCPSRAVSPVLSSRPCPSTPSSILAPTSACGGVLPMQVCNTKPSCSHFRPGITQSGVNPHQRHILAGSGAAGAGETDCLRPLSPCAAEDVGLIHLLPWLLLTYVHAVRSLPEWLN